jgi:hypothetical protein
MKNKPYVGSSTGRSGYELASRFEVNRHAEAGSSPLCSQEIFFVFSGG